MGSWVRFGRWGSDRGGEWGKWEMGKLGNGGGGEKEIGAGGGLGIWESKVDAVVESRKYCRLLGMEGGKWEKFRVGNMGVGKVGSRGNGEDRRRGEGLVGRGVGGTWGTMEWWVGGGEGRGV